MSCSDFQSPDHFLANLSDSFLADLIGGRVSVAIPTREQQPQQFVHRLTGARRRAFVRIQLVQPEAVAAFRFFVRQHLHDQQPTQLRTHVKHYSRAIS